MCNRRPPLKIIILQFCTATASPSLELPDGCRRVWDWGCRGRGRGRQSRGWGKVSAGTTDRSSEGFLTTHRSHCSKT